MSRPKNKPDYNQEKIVKEILKDVIEAYEHLDQVQRAGGNLAYGALKELSDQLSFKPSKVRKLLITAGVHFDKEIYVTDSGRLVLSLYKEGKSTEEIMKETGLKRSAVFSYLPYTKTIYKADELSTDAERIRLYRQRQKHCDAFMENILLKNNEEAKEYLWFTLEFLQGCIFYTSGNKRKKGQRFRYVIGGEEMNIDISNKPIAKDTIIRAFDTSMKIVQGDVRLNDLWDVSHQDTKYLFPVFLRLGLFKNEESAAGIL